MVTVNGISAPKEMCDTYLLQISTTGKKMRNENKGIFSRPQPGVLCGSIRCLILPLLMSVIITGNAQSPPDDRFRPFVHGDYDPKEFHVSQSEFQNGSTLIRIIHAKKTSKKHSEPPHICRAWIEIIKAKQTIFKKYFDDIDPVGFSYGLFIPDVQPPAPYFAVVKNGDYDGHLYLVNEDGKVDDLMGGFYFMTNDRRYLFSQYASDGTGLVVFDLKAGRIVYSSNTVPYIHQWYAKNGEYFFTESEWIRSNLGTPTEKASIAHFYDFKKQQIISKETTAAEIAAAKKLTYDFDPRKFEDCTTGPYKSPKRVGQ
jgi:hypothetical protein